MLGIGLMSGTSLDGVDAALVLFKGRKTTLIKCVTLPYDATFKNELFRNLHDATAKLSEISRLNFRLGYYFKDAIDLVLQDTGYVYDDITFVASHGQTIWHDPHGNPPSTLQIGEASVISYLTGIQTISNFRAMDVVAGGEGAPLVPFSEYYQFRSKTKDIVLQNIGGISNLTYLKKNATPDDIISFDCGVGNIMIDYFAQLYFHIPYDDQGAIALQGTIIPEVYAHLIQDEFIKRTPPKSTGREQYSHAFMNELATQLQFERYRPQDILTTITEFTVYGIVYHYLNFLDHVDQAIICGGGSHNQYIMKRLKESCPFEVLTGEEFGINSDAKEAVAFAILGYQTIHHRPSNMKQATGAKEDVILGDITLNPHIKK